MVKKSDTFSYSYLYITDNVHIVFHLCKHNYNWANIVTVNILKRTKLLVNIRKTIVIFINAVFIVEGFHEQIYVLINE